MASENVKFVEDPLSVDPDTLHDVTYKFCCVTVPDVTTESPPVMQLPCGHEFSDIRIEPATSDVTTIECHVCRTAHGVSDDNDIGQKLLRSSKMAKFLKFVAHMYLNRQIYHYCVRCEVKSVTHLCFCRAGRMYVCSDCKDSYLKHSDNYSQLQPILRVSADYLAML